MKKANTYKCLIVEDEPIAAEILKDYISQVPHLELIDHAGDAMSALQVLNNSSIDILFLDIHLPGIKGVEFLRTLKNPPHVIMTTAYSEYAVDAFDLEVLDYLTKPIEFSRFLKAISRLPISSIKSDESIAEANLNRPFRFFNTNKKQVKIYLDEILYIESLKDYIKIHTYDQSIVTKGQIGWIHAVLKSYGMIRIHRSFLVSIDKITAFTSNQVEISDIKIPIGGSYRSEVNKVLHQLDGVNE
ncbi:MAG: response regulator transcription factor [Saprospiraceae bacterium]|nr:response regulator transcription factor [Saprospiraceae bacterium]